MSDWRTYDAIPEAYAHRWERRFEEAARRLLTLARAERAERLLDLGTGTGALLAALGARRSTMLRVAACDLSLPMLKLARRHTTSVVAAEVTGLPFTSGTFDIVTANCVLSHVRDCDRVLSEARRVLEPGGVFAATSWGPPADEYAAAWNDLLGEAVTRDALARALEEVGPHETYLSSIGNLSAVLREAGLRDVDVEASPLAFDGSVVEYLAEREIGAAGRFGRHVLGEGPWRLFIERAEREFVRRFGGKVSYARPLLAAVGRVP